MDQLLGLLVMVVIFAVVAYGLWWVCNKFGMPQPVMWIVGAVLLIFLLYFIAGQVGGHSFGFTLRR
jgi:hypothetical protein